MDGKLDTVREALIKLRDFAKRLDCDYQEKCTPGEDDMCESCKHVYIAELALAALSAIDPDAIKRECATNLMEKLRPIIDDMDCTCGGEADDSDHSYEICGCWKHELLDILSAEPAQDDRLKPFNYDDENPCASCRADDPSDCEECETIDTDHVDSGWKPKPALEAFDRICTTLLDIKAQRDELLAVLADIGSYTGEGRLNSAWQSIVKSMGEKARVAIANAEKDNL